MTLIIIGWSPCRRYTRRSLQRRLCIMRHCAVCAVSWSTLLLHTQEKSMPRVDFSTLHCKPPPPRDIWKSYSCYLTTTQTLFCLTMTVLGRYTGRQFVDTMKLRRFY